MEEEEGPLHHALHNFFIQGYVDIKRVEDVTRAGVQFLDAFKTILTNNTASTFEAYGGEILIEYSLKLHIFQVKRELHKFKATNPMGANRPREDHHDVERRWNPHSLVLH